MKAGAGKRGTTSDQTRRPDASSIWRLIHIGVVAKTDARSGNRYFVVDADRLTYTDTFNMDALISIRVREQSF